MVTNLGQLSVPHVTSLREILIEWNLNKTTSSNLLFNICYYFHWTLAEKVGTGLSHLAPPRNLTRALPTEAVQPALLTSGRPVGSLLMAVVVLTDS